MPGKVIGTEMLLGYPGSVSRSQDAIIRNRVVKTADLEFGAVAVLNTDNTYSPAGAAFSMDTFAGIAAREVKQTADYIATDGLYKVGQPADVVERGSVMVVCPEGTPTAGGKVYVCTVAGTTAAVGDILATNAPAGAGATAVEITNAKFATGKIDANKVVEIVLTGRNQA